MNRNFFYYQLMCVALLPIIMQGAESHKFSNIITCAIKGISNKQSEPQTDYTSGITRALGHIRTQGQPQQPYASTIAQPRFNDTAIINYKSLEEIPSQTLQFNLKDTEGGNTILWNCSSLHPSITKDMIEKAFSYAEKIRQGIDVEIAHKDIIPCCLIAQYLLFEQTITSYFAATFLKHSASLDLTTYFNKATLGIDDNKLITQYHSQFIERVKQDAPSLNDIPDIVSVFEKNLEEIVVDENATTYMLDFSCKALQYVLYSTGNAHKVFKDIPQNIKNSITAIDLSGHELTTIDISLLKSVFPNLLAIDLTNNNIHTLNDQFFKQLPDHTHVILTNNPIVSCTNTPHPRSGCILALDAQSYTLLGSKVEKLLKLSATKRLINRYSNPMKVLCVGLPIKIACLLPAITTSVATTGLLFSPAFLAQVAGDLGSFYLMKRNNMLGNNKIVVEALVSSGAGMVAGIVVAIGTLAIYIKTGFLEKLESIIQPIGQFAENQGKYLIDIMERKSEHLHNRVLKATNCKDSIVICAQQR